MQHATPKQFLPLGGLPLIFHTLSAFSHAIDGLRLIVVLPKVHLSLWEALCERHHYNTKTLTVVTGGPTRFHSVKNGLALLKKSGFVAVHDAVRPFASELLIRKVFEETRQHGSCIPVIPLKDSLRNISGNQSVAVSRSDYRLVQTPQCFKTEILHQAYQQEPTDSFTDDACVVEQSGQKIHLAEGEPENIKITTPFDLQIAKVLLEKQTEK